MNYTSNNFISLYKTEYSSILNSKTEEITSKLKFVIGYHYSLLLKTIFCRYKFICLPFSKN